MQGGAVVKSYTIGHDVFLEAIAANQVRHLLKDGHGSTRQLVDALGNIIQNGTVPQVFAYDAYGNPHGFTLAQALTTHLYSGEQTDQLTGLQYLRARYYNPATGTFNRPDPFFGNLSDPQSLHKYVYTHGDPVNGVDPSGHMLGLLLGAGFQGWLRGMYDYTAFRASVGAFTGAVFGAIDAALNDGNVAASAFWGGVIGGAIGAVSPFIGAGFRALSHTAQMVIRYALIVSTSVGTIAGATESYYLENYEGMGFRLIAGAVSLGSLMKIRTCFVAGTVVWVYESGGSDTSPASLADTADGHGIASVRVLLLTLGSALAVAIVKNEYERGRKRVPAFSAWERLSVEKLGVLSTI